MLQFFIFNPPKSLQFWQYWSYNLYKWSVDGKTYYIRKNVIFYKKKKIYDECDDDNIINERARSSKSEIVRRLKACRWTSLTFYSLPTTIFYRVCVVYLQYTLWRWMLIIRYPTLIQSTLLSSWLFHSMTGDRHT